MTTQLKEFRKNTRLSQKSMAESMGVSLSMYEKVERGNKRASRNFMESIKRKYPNVSIDKLFLIINRISNAYNRGELIEN